MGHTDHRTTVRIRQVTWAKVEASLAYEQRRGIVPHAMRPAQYAALLVERQVLGQAEGWADRPPWRRSS